MPPPQVQQPPQAVYPTQQVVYQYVQPNGQPYQPNQQQTRPQLATQPLLVRYCNVLVCILLGIQYDWNCNFQTAPPPPIVQSQQNEQSTNQNQQAVNQYVQPTGQNTLPTLQPSGSHQANQPILVRFTFGFLWQRKDG